MRKTAITTLIVLLSFSGFAQEPTDSLSDIFLKLEKLEQLKLADKNSNSIKLIKTKDPKINVNDREVQDTKVDEKVVARILKDQPVLVQVKPDTIVDTVIIQPQIDFVVNQMDAGEIVAGDIVVKTFEFTNTGEADLEIFDVAADCSCTSPDWTKGVIKPGEKGFVKMSYDSKDDIGKFHKVVTVIHNSGKGYSFLEIDGFVSAKL